MAKRQSFADKASKKAHVENCPVCNSAIAPTLFVLPEKTSNGSIKYKKSMIKVCKCNHKQYYG